MVDGSSYNRMLLYGYNSTCQQNIAGEVQYGYKVSEPGTWVQSTKSPRLFRGEYSLYIRAKLTSAVSHHDSYIGFCCVY